VKRALCAGSFDPITNGHMDIIERAALIFDELLVTVFTNPTKKSAFSKSDRLEMVQTAVSHLDNVVVDSASGLLVDYAREHDVRVIIKGLRAVSDFEYEFQQAQMNKWLDDRVETLFMMTKPEHSYLSSSIVRELYSLGSDISQLVPPGVLEIMKERWRGDDVPMEREKGWD